MDSIPKEGGNTFSGVLARASARRASLQNDNITDELRPFISVEHDSSTTATTPTWCSADRSRRTGCGSSSRSASRSTNNAGRRSRRACCRALPERRRRSNRAASSSPHETVRLTTQVTPRNKVRVGVLQVAGRHAALRRRLRGDERQRGRVHRAGSGVRAAARRCSTPVRRSGRRRSRSRLLLEVGQSLAVADLQVQLPAGERPARHPAPQRIDRAADGGLGHGPSRLLQPDLEHGRQRLVRHGLAQLQGRREPPVRAIRPARSSRTATSRC